MIQAIADLSPEEKMHLLNDLLDEADQVYRKAKEPPEGSLGSDAMPTPSSRLRVISRGGSTVILDDAGRKVHGVRSLMIEHNGGEIPVLILNIVDFDSDIEVPAESVSLQPITLPKEA